MAKADRQSEYFYFHIFLVRFLSLALLLLFKFARRILIGNEDDRIVRLLGQLFALNVPHFLLALLVEAVHSDQQQHHDQQDGSEGEDQHTSHQIFVDLERRSDVGEGARVVVVVDRNVLGLR